MILPLIRKVTICFIVSLCVINPTALAVDLLQAYSDAQAHDPVILAAKARLLERGELIPQAYALILPNAGFNGSTSTGRRRGTSFAGTQQQREHALTLSLTQSLINVANWFNVSAASATAKSAQAAYLATEQSLITRTAAAYFAVLEAQDFLRFTQAEVKAFAQQLSQAEERHKVGVDPITNVYDARARYDGARSREIEAKNIIQNRFEDLRVITGHRYDQIEKLKDKLPLIKPKPTNIDEWEATAKKQNFAILSQQYAVKAAKSNVNIQRSGHLPTVDLFGNANEFFASRAGPGTIKTDNQSANIGLQLNWNILEGGGVLSRTRAAHYLWKAALQDLEGAYRAAINQARSNYHNVMSRISQIDANRQAIISAESSVESNREAFKVGIRTILDVLDSQQELTRAQQAHASSQYAYLNSRLALKEAAGLLTVADLEEINHWLRGSAAMDAYVK